ncbi:CDP-diacylglycerol--glycerol-3-phosphate 3-phosphatidyltransferase [candidate division KSB1 bacterium]|nr:CDP-diacylglycerol--glycerol-3-phosphate 3-phosphatidyltransferase [candidate division KSB1 bacterium]
MNFPTQLTILRIILTPICVILFFKEQVIFKFASFVIFCIASLTDLYDGYYAKKFGVETKWGKFLDPLADKILVSSMLVCFYYAGYIKLWIVLLIVVRDVLITILRSYAIYKNQPIVTRQWARYKTFFQMLSLFFVFMVSLIDSYALAQHTSYPMTTFLAEIDFINMMMSFVAIFTAITGIFYFYENRNQIKVLIWALTGQEL